MQLDQKQIENTPNKTKDNKIYNKHKPTSVDSKYYIRLYLFRILYPILKIILKQTLPISQLSTMSIKNLFFMALLLVLIFARQRLHRINKTVDKPVPIPNYTQTELYFDQIVDHYNYVDTQTWKQRYFVISDFFNNKLGPVFLFICGEYVCPGVPEARKWAIVLAQRTQGLILILQHRYYGKSMPFGESSLDSQNLKFLNTQQALKDLAYFITQVKDKHFHNVENNPWITIGGSYPGAMSAWFRYKYPHLTVGAIASSAVVNAIEDFKDFDEQIYLSSQKSGNYCSDTIKKLSDYVQQKVTGNDSKSFLAEFKSQNLSPQQFLFYWSDVTVEIIQYGGRTQLCKNLKGKSLEQQFKYVKVLALQADPTDYSSFYLSNTTFAWSHGGGARSWNFQVCTEFGWLQTFSDRHPMRSKRLTIQFFRKWCQDSYGSGTYPKIQRSNLEFGAMETSATNLYMVNGDEDPWIWASRQKSVGGIISEVANCDDCAHCVQLYTPSIKDSARLTKIRDNQYLQVRKWIQDYWKSHPKKFSFPKPIVFENTSYL